MTELITPKLVFLDHAFTDKEDVLRVFAQRVVDEGRATDADQLFDAFMAREAKTSTGLGGGIAIPHSRSAAVTEATLVGARAVPKVDFGAADGPADLIFGIAAPDGADEVHLKLLAQLARSLVKADFLKALREAPDEQTFVEVVEGALAPAQPTPAAAATSEAPVAAAPAAAPAVAADAPLIVAVTSCATGIAHTYMAADSLKQAADAKGINFIVETQGSAGMTPLNPEDIKNADAVIFAHDVDVRDRARFAGKPVIDVPVKKGIDEPEKLLDDALANAKSANPKLVGGSAEAAASNDAESQGVGEKIRSWLMTGVSYMLPFVSAGGILIAIGFLLASVAWKSNGVIEVTAVTNGMDGTELAKWLSDGFAWGSLQSWAVLIFWVGKWSFSFLIPALSGYIAYGIADRPGIAPGFVGGFAAGLVGAGFLGGIITGFLGGFLAKWISSWKVPAGVRGIMPVVVTPLLSVGITGIATALIIGPPMKWINDSLTNGLNSMQGGSAVILGVIVGLMMCFDLGGPVNKVAYVFATTGLANAVSASSAPAHIMAAVMAAGMVPPLAIALATLIRPKLWTVAERDAGKSAWLLGASFVSEGAIPFAASDPLRMIPSFMVGGAVTGGLSMAFGAGSLAPHGGIWVLPLIGNPLMFVLALVIGFVVSALMLTVLKSAHARKLEHAA